MNRKRIVNFDKVCRYIAKNSFYTVERVRELLPDKGIEYFGLGIKYLGFGEYEIDLDYRRY